MTTNTEVMFGTTDNIESALSLAGAFIVDCESCVSVQPWCDDVDFILTLMRIKNFYTLDRAWPEIGSEDEAEVRYELEHGTLLEAIGYGHAITPELAENPQAQRALVVFNACSYLAGWCKQAWPEHHWK